ncbi:MAG: polymerase subunit sigma-70 [Caulobacteraceae bacterium]|nr:polymerase subunit sigma-70 [Caulobacteraceae bacterium]
MHGLSILAQASDVELAALAARDDAPAFETLVRRHAPVVRALLSRMGAQPSLADDLAQETFVAAYQHIGGFRDQGSLQGWLKQIAARLYVRRWRAEARYTASDATPDEGEFDPVGADLRLDLDRALDGLSAPERICVSMCSGAGFSHSEAGALLKMPAGTVKSHVKRGLDKLRRSLETGSAPTRSRRDG